MTNEHYIARCIQLAKNGLSTTYPNPMVGSVIVYKDTIIGEGWHYKAGQPHAEVNSINSVKDKSLLEKSTIYVSLEPCSHFGKTPPCSDLIIQHKIPNVVIGTIDPFAKVSGRGIQKLKDAGCKVTVGVLEKECNELNKRFFTFHTKKRPYIFLKWAETNDGFIAPSQKKEQAPVWISNIYAKQAVHYQRATEQAILVGTNTVVQDNPSLTTRLIEPTASLRVIIDLEVQLNNNLKIFNQEIPTLIITTKDKKNQVNIYYEKVDTSKNITQQICDILYGYKIQSLIVEGGKQTLQHFIDDDNWDEAFVYKGTQTNFNSGILAPKLKKHQQLKQIQINNNLLSIYKHD